jgi:amino acid adenylation domain-containing protein
MIEARRSAPLLASPPPPATVRELFERRAGLAPEAVALVFEERELTYRELDRGANRLAHRLLRLGVGPEVLVGVHVRRGVEMVVALLGIHKAGGAYVPLDPGFPPERLELMARDSGLKVLLTDRRAGWPADVHVLSLAESLDGSDDSCPEARPAPESLAYVIYTSGSTGRPKGVQVTHAALANFLLSMQERPGFSDSDVLVAVTTLSFDIAGLEIFLPLVSGGRLVVASREVGMDGARLAALLESRGATVLQATPVTWKLLLQAGWEGSSRLRIFCGGEALPRPLARLLLGRGAEVWNLYGPTETTIWSAVARIEPGDGPVPIGTAIAATDLRVLDDELRTVPRGAAGDLYIGGDGLARGYLGQPALTAERFVPDPFGALPGSRLYRTGDLARVAPDGQLECLGRSDHQVKVRGFRIELGEIEAVLLEHPGVRDAAVVAADAKSGEKRLVAYLVPREPALDLREVQDLLARRLPDYMRPAAFALLAELPLTPNKKVDRRALPEVGASERAVAPSGRTPAEEIVLGIWADLLETGSIGPDDDFFALGGQSLLAGQVVARLREALGVELAPGLLFEHPTPARLAAAVEARMRSGAGGLPPLERGRSGAPLPVSHAQERLWLYDQLEPGSNAFNLGYAFRLRGPLSAAALEESLKEIVRRHEVLRTRIVADGGPLQIVDAPPRRLLALVDLSGLPAADREERARQAVVRLQAAPFDLARGPVLRAALVRLAEEDHAFCLAIHHVACDGWSLGVLIHEVTVLYEAFSASRPSPLPDLPVQYADFGVWQRRWLAGDLLEEQLAYWVDRLGREPAALLPADRPPSRAGGALESVRSRVPAEVVDALVRLGREQGATLFMTLLGALVLLIHRYSGRERIVVGTMHANRPHRAVEELIGFFANVLPLRTTVDAEGTFLDLLREVRRSALEGYTHQDAPFEKIVERVRPDRQAGRSSIFQVMVVFQNVPLPPLRLPGVGVAPFDLGGPTKRAAYDLSLSFVVESRDLLVWVEYDAGLYERATAERLLAGFERALREIAADPSRRLADLPETGELWLTDPASPAEPASEPAAAGGLELAREKAAAMQDRVAARRSRLSEKQLALLKQRLEK